MKAPGDVRLWTAEEAVAGITKLTNGEPGQQTTCMEPAINFPDSLRRSKRACKNSKRPGAEDAALSSVEKADWDQ